MFKFKIHLFKNEPTVIEHYDRKLTPHEQFPMESDVPMWNGNMSESPINSSDGFTIRSSISDRTYTTSTLDGVNSTVFKYENIEDKFNSWAEEGYEFLSMNNKMVIFRKMVLRTTKKRR